MLLAGWHNSMSARPVGLDMELTPPDYSPRRTCDEADPDSMVKASLHPLNLDTRTLKLLYDLLSKLWASLVWILVFVVVGRKSVEVVDDIHLLGDVDAELVRSITPVGRDDEHRLGLDLCGNLLADFAQLAKGRVSGVFHEVGATDTEKVDGWPRGRG